MVIVLFASCAAGKAEADDYYYVENSMPSVEKGEGFDNVAGSGSLPSLMNGEYERKIIKTANVSAETKEFDEAIAYIESLCTSKGGYIESSSVRGSSINSRYNYRYANYTIRIPAENLDSFTSELGNTLNIVNSSSNANEVTSAYYDIKSRIEVLELQKASLQEMYDNYTDYKDIDSLLNLQDKLFDVIAEIEAYQTQIKLYDDQVAYSTMHLNISEVVDYTENPEEDTFFTRLGKAFVGGWETFVDIVSGLSVGIAYILPELVIAAVVVTLILVLTRNKRKAKKEKKNEESK
jgi:hypothetical protein